MGQELKNMNIIITGGTGFLGKAVIAELLKSSANIYTNYRDNIKFTDLKKYLADEKKVVGVKADLVVEKEVQAFFKKFQSRFKRLDVFINLVGGFWMGKEIADTPLEKWNFMLNLNLNSTFLCSRAAFQLMRKQCGGKIITVSAKTAEEFPSKMGAYAVSKAAVLALTKVLANEAKPYHIQVNSLLPSIIDTPMNRKSMPDMDYQKWVNPHDIGKLLVQLCKPEVKVLSQSALKIYGGI
jgi:NAD(P)-dependent dehydrogenase (short-subunit alcohol dehydrogenase family)